MAWFHQKSQKYGSSSRGTNVILIYWDSTFGRFSEMSHFCRKTKRKKYYANTTYFVPLCSLKKLPSIFFSMISSLLLIYCPFFQTFLVCSSLVLLKLKLVFLTPLANLTHPQFEERCQFFSLSTVKKQRWEPSLPEAIIGFFQQIASSFISYIPT